MKSIEHRRPDRVVTNISLRRAVRRAVQFGAVAAGLTAGLTPAAMAEPFPAQLELGSLLPGGGGDGSDGFALDGIAQYDFVGRSLSDLGDINGDGLNDFVLGSPGANARGLESSGRSFFIY